MSGHCWSFGVCDGADMLIRIDNVGGSTGRRGESGSASRVRGMGLGVVELASFEELELEELLS